MDLGFQFEYSNIVLIIRDRKGKVIKASKKLQRSFYNMIPLDNNIYFDNTNKTYWKKNTFSFFDENNNEYIQEEYINVTDLLLEKEKLLSDLKKDPLTKIANLNAVYEMQNKIELMRMDCVMVMCDVNDFKIINDTYGHLAGDKALVQIAKLFNSCVRNEDLIARIGGDEFFFLFMTDNMLSILEKMSILQHKVVELGEKMGLPLSVSIGVSYFNYGDRWDDKKKQADSSLYYVKHNTTDKNNVAYYDDSTGDFELYNKKYVKEKLRLGLKQIVIT